MQEEMIDQFSEYKKFHQKQQDMNASYLEIGGNSFGCLQDLTKQELTKQLQVENVLIQPVNHKNLDCV